MEVRPVWEDDLSPAHTKAIFGVVDRYDLSKEFPIMTLKRTYWYLMNTSETFQPKPQTEEGITEIKLIGNEKVDDFLKNTYRSTSEILGKELRQIITK